MTTAEGSQLEEALEPEGDDSANGLMEGMSRVSTTASAILEVVRQRARLRALWMERLWSEGRTSPDQGLAISPGEVGRILSDPRHEAERYASFVAEEGPAELAWRVHEADEALLRDYFFERMMAQFGLNRAERDLLVLLIAVELNPQLKRVLAYLADDTRATLPTAWMAAELFDGNEGARRQGAMQAAMQAAMQGAMRSLLRWRLAAPVEGEQAWQAKSAWNLEEAVLASVLAEQWVEPSLAGAVRWVGPEATRSLPRLYPELLAQMMAEVAPRIAHAQPEEGKREAVEVVLGGPDGAGREQLAAQFASELNLPLLSVNTAKLKANGGDLRSAMVRAARLARVSGAGLYWRDAEAASAADWAEVRGRAGLSIKSARQTGAGAHAAGPGTGSGAANEAEPESMATHRYALPPLDKARRAEVWAFYSSEPMSRLVAMQRLTPKEIRLVADAESEAAARAALRRIVPGQGELLHALACPYTWDDLVVPAELKRTLKSFEAEVRLRWEVYEDWGFSRLTHLGQGISGLFSGPSGTGKTMAAQVLARSLEMDLYRVDLAGVVNKYIGETEKRLRDVFDACERSGAVLFFDEADALFGSRMQVKDSHDRFANIEIDYLLQRIEQFDGIAILATNRKSDLDEAFLRRLRFVVDFLPPGKADRLSLWQKVLPERAPSGETIRGDIDFALLANELDVNGAQVKSIALGAAFLARQQGERIGMAHIEHAAQREYVKQGMRLRLPIGSALL